ncbi:MAG: hypothetical protein HKP27_12145 [Myxococcales bacterium]|nr:hypothetical protein [Myxococcales bacterium]
MDTCQGDYIREQIARGGSFACPHCGGEVSQSAAVPWPLLVSLVAFVLCAVWAAAGIISRVAPVAAQRALPFALAAGALLALGLLLFGRPRTGSGHTEAAEGESTGPAPDERELVHFVESRVQEILADLAADEAGAERVAMARETVSFEPEQPLVQWSGRPLLCGGPVDQAQVCPATGMLAVLLSEDTCEARLEVYNRDGDKRATFAPPEGFRFVELRLGYIPPFSVKRVAAVVRCRCGEPVEGAKDWQFQIDASNQSLTRLSPIFGD